MANTLKSAFEKLTAHNHLLVFMGILTLLIVVSVFIYQGANEGIHLLKLSIGLFVGFSAIILVFKYLFDQQKKIHQCANKRIYTVISFDSRRTLFNWWFNDVYLGWIFR